MTVVRTECPYCEREVDVRSTEILLMIREGDDEGTYAFQCPECQLLQDKPAEKRVAMLLIAAGCPLDAA